MYSMTGFGKGEYRKNGTEIVVELKSVNNRYLDVSVKAPHIFSSYEEPIRAKLREKIARGHIDVFVGYLDKSERPKKLYLDLAAAEAYVQAAKTLKERFPEASDDLSLTFLLRDVIKPEEDRSEDDEIASGLFEALDMAIENLKDMRRKEGERLKADLLSRMETIKTLREEIARRAPLVSEDYRKKLTERILEYLDGKADETRILTEAAVFADKCNIDEELTRLSSHIAEFCKICAEQTAARKLDFLIQEFNRECNTICSKSNDSSITRSALDMKNEIEKVREQIQNIE